MKKKMSLILSLVLSLVLAPLLASSQPVAAEGAVERIQSAGVLKIGTSADYPPYQWIVNVDGKDEIVGFEIDIAQEIADQLGVELEVVDMDFDGILPALVAGKVDLAVAGFTPTPEREKSVDFSQRVHDEATKNYILVLDEAKDQWTSADQIDEMTIAVQKGTFQEEWLVDAHPKAKVQAVPKQTDGILALTSGRADGLLVSEIVADIYLEHQPSLVVSDIQVEGLEDETSALAVKKGQEDLVEYIDEIISQLKESGQIEDFIKEATELMIETE